MRAIAEEAAEMVREYKGAYSGEHGDGLVRSEWIAPMFGPRITHAFEEIKGIFDSRGLMNPGKIVRPSKMDDRTLFRYKPDYITQKIDTALDWKEWGGFDKAVEMCNNNGHCRKFDAGTMCPSFRATGDEQHLTRGRANTLRLAISGQLGPGAFTSDAMYETMDLCVSCKGCKRECPTGIDMAKMKIEFLYHYRQSHALPMRERLIAYLPRYAPWAAQVSWLLNLRDRIPGLAALSEKLLGLSARRSLPRWRADTFSARSGTTLGGGNINGEVVLLVDTFNNYFEPDNARAALAVLRAAGYLVHLPQAIDNARPLCCGRTFLAAGLVDQAKAEAQRTLLALKPFIDRGVPVIGLEPSCLLGLRDEFTSMLPGADSARLASHAILFEEFLARESDSGRLKLKLKALSQKKALLHGHCHQKAFDVMPALQKTLRLVPQLEVETIESSCCGMAGSFGYEAEHFDVSMKMAEASLLPKVRAADAATLIIADGTSCRHQIHDGTQRPALHVARVLQQALAAATPPADTAAAC
jgi:Fe-S oxidoreductase